jgi:hypothetical protein
MLKLSLLALSFLLLATPGLAQQGNRGGGGNNNSGNTGVSKSGPGAQHHIYGTETFILNGGGGGRRGGGHGGGDGHGGGRGGDGGGGGAGTTGTAGSQSLSTGGTNTNVTAETTIRSDWEAPAFAPPVYAPYCNEGASGGWGGGSVGLTARAEICDLQMTIETLVSLGMFEEAREKGRQMSRLTEDSGTEKAANWFNNWFTGPIFRIIPWIGKSAY